MSNLQDDIQEFIRINANGHDAVIIDLVKQQQALTSADFAENVKQKQRQIKQHLPRMVLKTYYDQSAFVSNSIDGVLECICHEGLILAISLIVFLRSFRASVTVIIIIPITLALTFTVMNLAGITLNIMSLAATLLHRLASSSMMRS